MARVKLPGTTVVSVNCISPQESLRAIARCVEQCSFDDLVLITDRAVKGEDVRAIRVGSIVSIDQYSWFMVKELYKYISTEFCLVVQPDGFILNAMAWDHRNFEYDFIGAPWHDKLVGNGGFSLRSRRFLYTTACVYTGPEYHPEDDAICRRNRAFMEKSGIQFAPFELAERFAVDDTPYRGQFGFHGRIAMRINHIEL